MADFTQKPNTSTMIRNFYSDGMSYLNVKFYNTNLSFQFHPFVSKDATGRSTYDNQKALMTTVNWEGAFTLFNIAEDIISGKNTGPQNLVIPCAGDAALIFERKAIPMASGPGQMETIFSIKKNNEVISFKFKTTQVNDMSTGQPVVRIIECGLGAFMKTLNGYLEGINADRHLDKMTEQWAATQNNSTTGGQPQYQGKPSYNNQGGYQKKPWQNNRKPYNNYNNNTPTPAPAQGWETQQQNVSSYQLPN